MAGPGSDYFGDEERQEVLDVISTGRLSRYGDLGDPSFKHKVYDLEREVCATLGCGHAVATNSGTSALLIALLALGIGEGDEVLMPGFTYVATMAAVVHVRAVPVLVEVDDSLTIDVFDLKCKITDRSRAILAVHMLGNPCAMLELTDIARSHGLELIEDVCQAAGGSYRGRRLGTFGNVGTFSLNRYKTISAGEGGVAVTDDSATYDRLFALHDHGHLPLAATKVRPQSSILGLNLKMPELTAAVALAQVRKLDSMLSELRANKRKLLDRLPRDPEMSFRLINDIDGECATFACVIFDDAHRAAKVAARLGTKTLFQSGWHNYYLMEQVAHHRTPTERWSPVSRFAAPGELPTTDDILSRTINISVGVVDTGLAADFGITIKSTDEDVTAIAKQFADACRSSVGIDD